MPRARFRRSSPRWILPVAGLLGGLLAIGSAHARQPAAAVIAPGGDGYPAAPMAATFETVSPDGVEVAGWGAGACARRAIATAWGGERPSFGTDGQPSRSGWRATTSQATLDPAKHTVEGKEHLRWLNRSDRPITEPLLPPLPERLRGTRQHLHDREGPLRRRSAADVETKKGEWGYVDVKSVTQAGKLGDGSSSFTPTAVPTTDHTVVRVDLPEPIRPGATGELDVEFHDQLPRVVARTGYFDAVPPHRAVVSQGRRSRAAR